MLTQTRLRNASGHLRDRARIKGIHISASKMVCVTDPPMNVQLPESARLATLSAKMATVFQVSINSASVTPIPSANLTCRPCQVQHQ